MSSPTKEVICMVILLWVIVKTLTQVCTVSKLENLFQGLKKKKIAGHRTPSTSPLIPVPAFQNPLHTMTIQARAEEDYLILQLLWTLNMSYARKIQKNFGKSSIVTFEIQVAAFIKQASSTIIITFRHLQTEAINSLVVSVLNLKLIQWWSFVRLRVTYKHLHKGMKG